MSLLALTLTPTVIMESTTTSCVQGFQSEHITRCRQAITTFDVQFLEQWYRVGVPHDATYSSTCSCGCREDVSFSGAIVSGHFSSYQIDRLFDWTIIRPTDITLFSSMVQRIGTISGMSGRTCTGPQTIIHMMRKMDTRLLASYRTDYGCTIAHLFYYSSMKQRLYMSSILRYLVEDCGMDPRTETYLVSTSGEPDPESAGEGVHGQSLLYLAIISYDLASIYYLVSHGCTMDQILQFDDELGRDALMQIVHYQTHRYEKECMTKIQELHDRSIARSGECRGYGIAECPECAKDVIAKTIPAVDCILIDVWQIIEFCVESGYLIHRKDKEGKTLEDYILDLKSIPQISSYHDSDQMIRWYRGTVAGI
jgi:hypothetical protein